MNDYVSRVMATIPPAKGCPFCGTVPVVALEDDCGVTIDDSYVSYAADCEELEDDDSYAHCLLDKYVYAASVSCEHCHTQKYLARLNRDYVVVLQKVVKDWNTRRYVP